LDEAFGKWWPDLEQKVEAISSAVQQPSGPHRSVEDLLEEAVSNTRSILRELQSPTLPPPWQRLALTNPEVVHTVEALLRRPTPQGQGLGQGLLDEYGGLTVPKSE
jgi:hypothetical protein